MSFNVNPNPVEELDLFADKNVLPPKEAVNNGDMVIVDETPSDSETESEPEVEEKTQMSYSTPAVVLCIGRPKRGKTNLIKHQILRNTAQNPLWKMGIVFSKTAKLSKDYDFIPDEYKFTEYSQEILETYSRPLGTI